MLRPHALRFRQYFSADKLHGYLSTSIEISMVISNKRNAGVFEKVEKYKIPTLYINKESYKFVFAEYSSLF